MDASISINLKDELRKRYGAVRRAYDNHLYTAKGTRILDLYQESGEAILGWRAGKAKLALKNALDRGITGSFPTELDGELERAVREVLPDHSEVRVFASRDRARRACAEAVGLWSDVPLIESPILHPEASIEMGPGGDSPLSAAKGLHGIPLWRPWLDEAFYAMGDRVDSSFLQRVRDTLDAMVLVSPFPFASGCAIAVFSGRVGSVPPSDPVAPALLAALARAWRDLAAALFERTEADWSRFDGFTEAWWDRRGPYLVPKTRPSRYAEFFSFCLDRGVLISPDYLTPSIVPMDADAGEFRALERNPVA